ncbi:hypothetical protein HYX70_02370 [Candidatus Saccharibacteria bacterium]|nr:hypothetical protein [Candidatus Saccharibacteria bacterium]
MIIGIAGGSCSGKTTLIEEIQKRLGDEFSGLSFDDYFVGEENLPEVVEDWENPSLYRYDEFITDLKSLRQGKTIHLRTKSRESTASGVTSKQLDPNKFTFIEGFLIFYDPAAVKLFDKKVFIDLPEEQIVQRRLDRSDGVSRWDLPEYINKRLIPGHRNYVQPQSKLADIVVNGEWPTSKMANVIIKAL